jgi:dipeptidyl aminopeptidase/acylaminoacyl peptidase
MIPGHKAMELASKDRNRRVQRSSKDGFASVAVSQPRFGKSAGSPDFVGPKTIAALTEGYRKLRQECYVDPARMGIFGYSRGAMAASLFAVDLDDVKAAVFGADIYAFQRAYDENTLPGVRQNMRDGAGMTEEAVRERSSILKMERLKCRCRSCMAKKMSTSRSAKPCCYQTVSRNFTPNAAAAEYP